MQHQFILEDCVITIDVVLYRLTLQRNINDKSLDKIVNVANALINEANISDRIEFIGINYKITN